MAVPPNNNPQSIIESYFKTHIPDAQIEGYQAGGENGQIGFLLRGNGGKPWSVSLHNFTTETGELTNDAQTRLVKLIEQFKADRFKAIQQISYNLSKGELTIDDAVYEVLQLEDLDIVGLLIVAAYLGKEIETKKQELARLEETKTVILAQQQALPSLPKEKRELETIRLKQELQALEAKEKIFLAALNRDIERLEAHKTIESYYQGHAGSSENTARSRKTRP